MKKQSLQSGRGAGIPGGPVLAAVAVAAVLLGYPWAEASVLYLPQKITAPDGTVLEGQLALPSEQEHGKLPAVLLLAGSGVTNRYENVPASATRDGKPGLLLKPIEEALLKQGVAVFVYDKRGVKPTDRSYLHNEVDAELMAQADARTLASDALASFDHLSKLPQVDPQRIAVLGHSEGSILALKIAEVRPNVRSVGYVGGFNRSFRKVSDFQARATARRVFLALDRNHDGRLSNLELAGVLSGSSSSGMRLASVSGIPVGSSRGVSLAQWQGAFAADNDRFWNEAEQLSHPWPYRLPRQWYQQYAAEGAYLQRELKFCGKTHVFHGVEDAQTPYEDARVLKRACIRGRKPLAGFLAFPRLGHGLTAARPGDGMDALGPMDTHAAQALAKDLARSL